MNTGLDDSELWRQIPPEEKIQLVAKSQASGLAAAVAMIIICGTVAVGLHQSWLLWASLILSPLVFQYAAGKSWRGLKPKTMLEYLAARTAARRYAFSANSKEMTVTMMLRGELVEDHENEALNRVIKEIDKGASDAAQWITLFSDAVVIMSEGRGGARLELAHLLDDKLKVEAEVPAGEKEYSSRRTLHFSFPERGTNKLRRFKLTSKHPAALIAFEKKLLQLQNHQRQLKRHLLEDLTVPDETPSDSDEESY